MPQGFSFDGDTAYYASLKEAVEKQEADKQAARQDAEKERRRSLGLPEEEKKGFWGRRKSEDVDPARKNSMGERIANFVWNAGRPAKVEKWQEERGPSKEFR